MSLRMAHRLAMSAAALAMVLAACSAPSPTPAAAPTQPAAVGGQGAAPAAPTGSPIKIGVLDDITGVGAIEGALLRVSTDLVVEQTNATGGINGHPLQVIYVDPKGDATQALQLGTQLVQQDDVDVLAGGIF